MDYDFGNRLVKVSKNIGGSSYVISQNQYNSLGQLVLKKVGEPRMNLLTNIDIGYDYNIRGSLAGINKDYA